MKKGATYFTILSLIFLNLLPSLLIAANNTIVGLVIDSKTNETLPGANVSLEGTAIGAATDLDGEFYLTNIPSGKHILIVSYIGYREKRIEISVEEGEKKGLTIEMEYSALELDEAIIVTAQAEGQMKAINQQLSAIPIINVVSSDRIQELPDANAAESVGRLPGVSILREGGEGNKVVIRGLSPKYNTIMIEGVKMSPTDPSDRSTDLSMISPYMLDGIQVMKAITPDQYADAIGGVVNFTIKEAQEKLEESGEDQKLLGLDLIARGGYNDLKNTYSDYKLVAEVSTRLLENRLGVLAQIDLEKRNRSSQEMGAGYYLRGPELGITNPVYIGGLNLGNIGREKERYGGTFVVDYRIPDGKISFKNILSKGKTTAQNYSESLSLGGDTHDYYATDAESKLDVMTNILDYNQHISSFNVDAQIAHSYSENEAPTNIMFHFHEKAAFDNFDDTAHPNRIPSFANNDLDRTYLYDVGDNRSKSQDRQITLSANLQWDYNISSLISGNLKTGGKYRYTDREYDLEAYGGLMWVGGATDTRRKVLDAFPWMLDSDLIVDESSWFYYPVFLDNSYDPGTFLNGEYKMGPVTDINLMREMIKVIRTTSDLESYHKSDIGSTVSDYTGNENLSAGYIMADVNIGSTVNIIPGIRYEQLKSSYSASQGDSRSRGADLRYPHIDTTVTQTHGLWLPMVHVRYKPVSWFDVRFAYTNTLSRPDFINLTPAYNISLGYVSWNNYRIKPLLSENFDLYLSFYQNHVGLFTVGGFIKNIQDMIYGTSNIILDPSEYNLPDFVRNYEISTTKNNPNKALVKGIELDWQTNFWYLPGLLRGLVFNANYTHIFSETEYPRTIVEIWYDEFWQAHKTYIHSFYSERMLDQADDVVNATIGYDYKDFSVRFSMLYQSDIFHGTDFWPELRRITDDYLRWDISIKQDLPWEGLQVFGNVNNLNAAMDVDLNQGNLFPVAEQHYGMTVDIGLRFRY
jgi:TonB-dependent receptor